MDYLIYAIIFFMGASVGSFLNVCASRIPAEESIVKPPSHCNDCGYVLAWYDLIPLFSWLFLRGKCRKCGAKLSSRYFFVELFTGLMFLLLFMEFGVSLKFAVYLIFTCFLIVIGLIDFDTQDIYDIHIIAPAVVQLVFIAYMFLKGENVMTYFYGALAGGGFISLIVILTHGMGWGDAELCALCGLVLGFKYTLLTIFIAIVLGGIVGVIVLLTRKKGRKDAIAFGPFIAMGAMAAMLWGQQLIDCYVRLIVR
ncbi:leader peptidase (prepilin peptidase) / N-methyltransferase [Hathewaya proteolytica DSM 3090]|uniref:Leader peptidase (Prepilin peptidase) / N-methyltransferase n=1 Tax=Hathewaya proteolytica DSM 3090 TaxID=1121331 RepID=A0A1M6LH38_9CLOT|nr:A24 family peptidase [Hathewaya proteolytica]SHJ70458.1 leader peptidase (prepilin peptidase) / N-methyltransferase [Hathewaya proteolytica DSM 3090]